MASRCKLRQREAQWQKRANTIKPLLPCSAMKFIFTCSQMPIAQPAKLPYCGADAATEELLPEPSQDALRLAELEAENQRLRDDLRHLQSALASAVGLLLP